MIVPRGQYQGRGPLAVFGCAWHYRQLVLRLTLREIEARFRGSLLGKLWAGIVPLFMLSLYTFVFGFLFKVRWPGLEGSTLQVALLYFSGLILFDFVLECLTRAPALLADQIAYVKKVLFPLEILAWVVIGGALFRVLVGAAILLVFYVAIDGLPPLAVLSIAVLVLALVTMFLTPVFFPLSTVSEPIRSLLYLNPLTFVIEAVRAALFLAEWPNWAALALYGAIAWIFAWAGRAWFLFVRGEFADVV